MCFPAEVGDRRYLDELTGLSHRFGCAVPTELLMIKHAHLLLTPERADSAAFLMKHLGQSASAAQERVEEQSKLS